MPLYQSVMTALGWSLLDSIWQMAALWLAFVFITGGEKHFSAAEKHNLALLFVLISSSWFIYSFVEILTGYRYPLVSGPIPASKTLQEAMPYLSILYIFLLAGRFFIYWIRVRYSHSGLSGRAEAPLLQTFADTQARIMGISRTINVYLCQFTETAQTSGFLKPVILLPFSLITRLSAHQLEAIITHELHHIRRNDYLIQIGMSCFRSVFFFNPFALFLYRTVARERELACDDGVLDMGYPPKLYAEALFHLEKIRQVQPGFLLSADGNKPWLLMARIRRVLGETGIEKKHFKPWMLFLGMLAVFSVCLQHKELREIQTPVLPPNVQRHDEAAIQKPEMLTHVITMKTSVEVSRRKITRVSLKIPVAVSSNEDSPEDPAAQEIQTYFTDEGQRRDFSNQATAGAIVEPILSLPESPFVPSVSLTYEGHPEIVSDSSHMLVVMDNLKMDMDDTRNRTTVHLKKLEIQFEKNKKEFKNLELKNRMLIEFHKKDIHPILEKIQEDLQSKKQEIDRIRLELKLTSEEIIHI